MQCWESRALLKWRLPLQCNLWQEVLKIWFKDDPDQLPNTLWRLTGTHSSECHFYIQSWDLKKGRLLLWPGRSTLSLKSLPLLLYPDIQWPPDNTRLGGYVWIIAILKWRWHAQLHTPIRNCWLKLMLEYFSFLNLIALVAMSGEKSDLTVRF